MDANRYRDLVATPAASEAFVRRALAYLESDFRTLALAALSDWERTRIVASELFQALAGLQRPSWGTWNGLLGALRSARREALRTGSAAERQKVEQAAILAHVLQLLDERLDAATADSLKPLCELTRWRGGKLTTGSALSMAIGVRNLVAHDPPTDEAAWDRLAVALRPMVQWVARRSLLESLGEPVEYPPPWFEIEGTTLWTFSGLEQDFSARYVAEGRDPRYSAEGGARVSESLKRLLGKADVQERDFRKLLSKLAPEEVKGVLMGDFLVGRPVGEGGFAAVHVGRQLSTGRQVAVKILNDGTPEDIRLRFQQEAAYLSRFSHPNIVGVYAYEEETWRAPTSFSLSGESWFEKFSKSAPVKTFIALEWIEGETLESIYQKRSESPVALGEQMRWFLQAANALSVVHASGLIHRDIKPGNLMLSTDGTIKLMDFGVARTQVEERTIQTTMGKVFGTPAYMSPEQIRAADAEAEVGPGTDIYSLCATFYELCTGTRLYHHDRESAETVKTLKLSGRMPESPRRLVRGLPWEVETILLGGLQPELSDRYRTVAALERDLRHFASDEPIEYQRPSAIRRMQLMYRRNRSVSNLAACFLALAVAGTLSYINGIKAEQRRTEQQKQTADENAAEREVERTKADENAAEADRQKEAADKSAEQARLQKGIADQQKAIAELAEINAVAQRDQAEAARNQAEDARNTAEKERQHAAEQRDRAERQNYFAQIALVQKMIEDGNIGDAENRLEDCKPALRRWEWGWLEHLCHLDRRTFQGPAQPVIALSFNPEGRRVSAAYRDGEVRVWDKDSGRELHHLAPSAEEVRAIAFSPDGTHLTAASGGAASKVITLDFFNGKTAKLQKIPDDQIVALEYSRDGRQIACGGDRRVIYLCEAETGRLLHTLAGHTGTIQALAYAPGGRQVASASPDGTVRVWDTATGDCESMFQGDRPFRSVAFDSQGRKLAAGDSGGEVWLWDTVSGGDPMRFRGPVDEISSVAFTPDGTGLAAGCVGKVKVWELPGGNETPAFTGHKGQVLALAYSPDGKELVSGGQDGAVKLWDSPGRPAAAVLWKGDPERLWGPYNVAFSPDGKYLAGGIDDMVLVFDVAQKREVKRLEGYRGSIASVTFSPDGKWIAGAISDRTVKVWDRDSGGVVFDKGFTSLVRCVAFSPDGRALSSMTSDGTIQGWDLQRGSERFHVKASGQRISAATFSPDGKRVLACGYDGSLRVWDTDKGDELMSKHWVDTYAECVAISPDGRLIVAGCNNRTVGVWDMQRGTCLDQLGGHISQVNAIAISGDSTRIASAEQGGAMRVWEIEPGEQHGLQLLLLNEGIKTISCIAFSRDGTYLATGSYDHTLRLWETASSDLLTPPAPK
jgi:WD40 repeat protein/serine/threonine protein kinase